MDAERWQRICDLFEAARAAEGEARAALLASAPDLAPEVLDLLGHHEDPSGSLDAPAVVERPDEEIGPYRIERVLGQGGMGTVYLAEGPEGPVALKRLHPQLKAHASIWERFRREAELGSRIRHPNVVRTMGIEGEACLVMEVVEGQTLDELMVQGTAFTEAECRHVAMEVGRALVAIHEAGAVHRDLKPSNVIRTPAGQIKVMDLGIALPLDDLLRLSATGQFVGTVRYSAPEQLSGSKPTLDGRADLYSLGLVLYEMAAGEHPIPPGGLVTTMRAHLQAVPTPLRERSESVTPFFAALVHALLAKDPEARPGSARALVDILEAGEDGPWWRERR